MSAALLDTKRQGRMPIDAVTDESNRVLTHDIPAAAPTTKKYADAFFNIAESTKPLARILWEQREVLGLSQGAVADALGIKSSEMIGLVERGMRRIDLNKIPLLADVLKLDREQLCRLALFEVAPQFALSVFGTKPATYTPGKTKLKEGEKSSFKITPEQMAYNQKLYALPSPLRSTVLSLIDQFTDLVTNTFRSGRD